MPTNNWKLFLSAREGSIAPIAALVLTLLLGVAGVTIDYTVMSRQKTKLQSVADSAALAGAREYSLANTSSTQVEKVAELFLEQGAAKIEQKYGAAVKWNANATKSGNGVITRIEQHWQPFFAHYFDSGVTPIVATATAVSTSKTSSICVLALSTSAPKSVFLDHDSQLTGQKCTIYSNSRDPDAIRADSNGKIIANTICSAGGVTGSLQAFSPYPITDCPPIADPLASRVEPKIGACTYNNTEIKSERITLKPGVYCGGLKIVWSSDVTFDPGVYIIKDDKYHVQDSARIYGKGVGFYLADESTLFEFTEGTTISLTAPEGGPLAGVLLFETRSAPTGRKHRINSNNAKVMVGTIYLPKGTLLVDSKAPVASESEFTVIIAMTVELLEQPNLVLNSNYSGSDVPVPEGLIGGKVRFSN